MVMKIELSLYKYKNRRWFICVVSLEVTDAVILDADVDVIMRDVDVDVITKDVNVDVMKEVEMKTTSVDVFVEPSVDAEEDIVITKNL